MGQRLLDWDHSSKRTDGTGQNCIHVGLWPSRRLCGLGFTGCSGHRISHTDYYQRRSTQQRRRRWTGGVPQRQLARPDHGCEH